jgi:phosphate/sulfate permease
MQFSGAVLLGRGVTSTIKEGIVDPAAFVDAPDIFMYGMFCALMSSAIWLIVATFLELPVSTTHSIFGYGSFFLHT